MLSDVMLPGAIRQQWPSSRRVVGWRSLLPYLADTSTPESSVLPRPARGEMFSDIEPCLERRNEAPRRTVPSSASLLSVPSSSDTVVLKDPCDLKERRNKRCASDGLRRSGEDFSSVMVGFSVCALSLTHAS